MFETNRKVRLKSLSAIAVAVLSVGVGSQAFAAGNLVMNGSFESGTNPGLFATVLGGDTTSITHWEVTGVSVDYIGSYWNASNIFNPLDLRSIDLIGSDVGGLKQTVTTIIGQQYLFSFDYSANPDGDDTIAKTGTAIAGPITLPISVFASNGNTLLWVSESSFFTATSTLTILSFAGLTESSGFGVALDNVSLVAVPLPPTVLAGGVALLGSFIYRMRKNRAAAI